MKRRLFQAALGILLTVAFAGSIAARDRLVVGYTSASGVFAGLWVAHEGKVFEKYGIDSHLVLIASGSLMVQAMLGGDVPFAAAAGSAAVDASLGGADITMLGTMVKVPAFYIMALPEIKAVEDLRGKTVGVTRFGSSSDFTMRYVLRKHGLEPGRDVTIIQTGDLFGAAAMLRTRAIVAAPFSSPTNLRAEDAGARVLLNMGKAGVYFPHDAFMARRSFVNANEDLVRRLLKGYSEGVYRLHTDSELSRRAIRKYARVTDPKVVEAVYQYALDYIDKIPYNTHQGVQEVLNQIAPRNPKARTASPESFYDDRFVKELETSGFYKQLWGK
ncbi:MAG: ABC transporter substrate-binding protein [Deltaproteobacteria bacterium]|nr:ABC transporter substrate-binding protein [Deltaproteobacteria bacterium]